MKESRIGLTQNASWTLNAEQHVADLQHYVSPAQTICRVDECKTCHVCGYICACPDLAL